MNRFKLATLALFVTIEACSRTPPRSHIPPVDAGPVDAGSTGVLDAGIPCAEIDTQSDPANCGTCGRACAHGTCTAGLCGCTNEGDCATNEACGTDGLCRTGPCADIQCALPAVCRDGACSVVGCSPDGGGCDPGERCVNGVCKVATCNDGITNGSETDVDCGGGTCAPCNDGKRCHFGGDCASGVCSGGFCQSPTCGDGVKNGEETDVDCGGSCTPCVNGRHCKVAGDCASNMCTGDVCVPATCSDTIKNGDETDVDCGGSCAPCPPGKACSAPGDCTSKLCTDGRCADRCAGVVCTPLDPCHDAGTCDPSTGLCSNPNKANGTACDDGNACTSGETCQSGVCGSPATTVSCTALDQCHDIGRCDPATGACSNPVKTDGVPCNDGNACTSGETCQSGACGSPTVVVTCPVPDQCHDTGTCNPVTGMCSNPDKPNGTACDDGNACTTGETCQGGTCASPAVTYSCPMGCAPGGGCADGGTGLFVFYRDADNDGYGNPNVTAVAATAPPGYVADNTDCNDQNPNIHPGAPEICNGVDDNCNNQIDEGVTKTFYRDADQDGFGDPSFPIQACAAPPGYVADNTDCDDTRAFVHPGATETCNGLDDNCNGQIDEGVTKTFYRDADNDGYGNPADSITACTQPTGYVANNTDCNDASSTIHPGAAEVCNGIDDNCDGVVDGETQPCSNACGTGTQTCSAGVWGTCSAPAIAVIGAATTLDGQSVFNFNCLEVDAALKIGADVTVKTTNWVHVNRPGGTVYAGPRAKIDSGGDIVLSDDYNMSILATDLTLQSAGTVTVVPGAYVFLNRFGIGDGWGHYYSGGGVVSCSDNANFPNAIGGAGGGSRGGNGGAGGSCGVIVDQPVLGAGGALASNGTAGCNCQCSSTAAGGTQSGGAGGAPNAGGGGGANGGKGGNGANGTISATTYLGGMGGAAEASSASGAPTVGGGGGGAPGVAYISSSYSTCLDNRYGNGAGGGILRVIAASFVNQGTIDLNGIQGVSGTYTQNAGGGGGGAAGSLVFHVGSFDNGTGLLSAQGGAGTAANNYGAYGCTFVQGGGGGGGGGGRVYIGGPLAGGSPTIVSQGNISVKGGAGGAGLCGQAAGAPGGDGWIYTVP